MVSSKDLQPLASIVMPSYNQGRFIEEALDSILSQSWKRLEVVVQDGGSTDETLEILTRKSAEDSRIRWTSEPDNGPAEAINKALSRTRGTIIGWLNSDDLYMPGAVERAVGVLKDPQWVMCYGEGHHVDEFGNFIERYPTLPNGIDSAIVPSIDEFQKGCFICQPTVFLKRTSLLLIGDLDVSYKASFDFDLWLRYFNVLRNRITYINCVQAKSRLHSSCITKINRIVIMKEGMRALIKNQNKAMENWLLSYLFESRYKDDD